MPTYLAPDVYVEEVSGGARPIEAVGASVAAFVGKAPDVKAHLNEPIAVHNWSQFLRNFVKPGDPSTPLARAVFGFFQNGGSRCFVVNVGENHSIVGDGNRPAGLDMLTSIDEIAIVAAPGFADAASYEALLSHCENLGDRVAILDPPEQVPDIELLTQPILAAEAENEDVSSGLRPRQSDGGYGTFYFPWLMVQDPLNPAQRVTTPPSGHVAGIWARTDATRGVHKAPANEVVRGALGLTYYLNKAEQELLNPAGVNCIRLFRDGIRVWGARTLAASSSEWRYLNVRRLVNVIKESIIENTRWIVFEPNDYTLWKSIRRDIGAFLTLLWRDGALMGRTPEEAFFVKCDEETNPPEVIDAGRVVTLIGIAPVKPAEFIVFRISQFTGGAEAELVGE
jgi:phage tail sheath protein FI